MFFRGEEFFVSFLDCRDDDLSLSLEWLLFLDEDLSFLLRLYSRSSSDLYLLLLFLSSSIASALMNLAMFSMVSTSSSMSSGGLSVWKRFSVRICDSSRLADLLEHGL